MRLIFLALLLSVAQTAPPVPRQAIENHTQKAGAKDHVAKDGQQPAAPLPLDVPVKVPAGEDSTAKSAANQAQNTNPNAKKDESWSRADELSLAYDILTGLLVIIGGSGVCFALRTLRAIESQTNAQIESLRARITFASTENTFTAILHDGYVDMRMKFINTGGTPAYKVSPETWIEFLPVNFEDFTENAKYHKGEPLAVYPQSPTPYSIPLGRKARYEEIAGLRNAQTTLGVRIRLTYETFGRMCIVDRALWLTPDGWVLHPKYNEAN